jgi:hypothetical protein
MYSLLKCLDPDGENQFPVYQWDVLHIRNLLLNKSCYGHRSLYGMTDMITSNYFLNF